MKSVDTNILVRMIVRDDLKQASIAETVMQSGVHVPLTVLLETAWVLSTFYQFDRQRLNAAFVELIDSDTIHVDDELAIRAALDLHRQGADIADVFHLVAAKGTEAFVTFDKGMKGDVRIGVDVEVV